MDIPAGECVALLGPNGAGKTTLLRLLSGLIYPTQGEIEFEGAKFSRSSIELRSSLGFTISARRLRPSTKRSPPWDWSAGPANMSAPFPAA